MLNMIDTTILHTGVILYKDSSNVVLPQKFASHLYFHAWCIWNHVTIINSMLAELTCKVCSVQYMWYFLVGAGGGGGEISNLLLKKKVLRNTGVTDDLCVRSNLPCQYLWFAWYTGGYNAAWTIGIVMSQRTVQLLTLVGSFSFSKRKVFLQRLITNKWTWGRNPFHAETCP